MNFYFLFAICTFPLVFLEATEEPNYYEPAKDFSSLTTNLNGTMSEEVANYESEDTNKETEDEVSEEAPVIINTEENVNEAEIDVNLNETSKLSNTNEDTEDLNEGVSESKDDNDQGFADDNDDGIEGDNDDSTGVEHESTEENNVDSSTKWDKNDEIDDDDEANKEAGRDVDTDDGTTDDMPKGYYIDPGVGANGQNLSQAEVDEFYKNVTEYFASQSRRKGSSFDKNLLGFGGWNWASKGVTEIDDKKAYPYLGAIHDGNKPVCTVVHIHSFFSLTVANCQKYWHRKVDITYGRTDMEPTSVWEFGWLGMGKGRGDKRSLSRSNGFMVRSGWYAFMKSGADLYNEQAGFNIGITQVARVSGWLGEPDHMYNVTKNRPINYTNLVNQECWVLGWDKEHFGDLLKFKTKVITPDKCRTLTSSCVTQDQICTCSPKEAPGSVTMIYGSALMCNDAIIGLLVQPRAKAGLSDKSVNKNAGEDMKEDAYMKFVDIYWHSEWIQNETGLEFFGSGEKGGPAESGIKVLEDVDMTRYLCRVLLGNCIAVLLIAACLYVYHLRKRYRRQLVEECICNTPIPGRRRIPGK